MRIVPVAGDDTWKKPFALQTFQARNLSQRINCFWLHQLMNRLVVVTLFLLLIGIASFGQQDYLMLQKRNSRKNAYYKIGDMISFRVKGSRSKITGEIRALQDSVIVFNGFEVHINQISSLYIDDKTKWWLRFKIEQLLLLGGSAYLLVDVINSKKLNSETAVISSVAIGGGLLAHFIIGNRIKLRGRTKLRILKFKA